MICKEPASEEALCSRLTDKAASIAYHGNGRYRRSAADGGRSREGPLTDPIADAQARRWELFKMHLSRSSQQPGSTAGLGEKRKFPLLADFLWLIFRLRAPPAPA